MFSRNTALKYSFHWISFLCSLYVVFTLAGVLFNYSIVSVFSVLLIITDEWLLTKAIAVFQLINIIKSITSLNLPWLSMGNIDSIYSGEHARMTTKITSLFLNSLLTIYSMYQISLDCELKAGVTIQFYKTAQWENM